MKKILGFLLLLLCFQTSVAEEVIRESLNLMPDSDTSEHCSRYSHDNVALSCKSYHQTRSYTCGPAAVMTLLHYYGKLDKSQMNAATEMRIANEMKANEEGTTPYEVVNWLSDHGMHVDSGANISTDDIIANLKKGIPTILSYNRHWIVAKGYNKADDPDYDEIVFADSCCDVTVLTRSTIDSMWASSQLAANHCDYNVGYYIVAVP